MHVLVVATPQHPIPPAELPGLVEGAAAWAERHKEDLTAFGLFPGGGGFGIAEVDDASKITQLIMEMPFSPYSHHDVRPFVPGEQGLAQMREMLAAQAASH
jgi:hypothetical protein